jgi:hypothetical protein
MPDIVKDKKHRSPAYPFIPLAKAIDRAQTLYDRERRHPTPLRVASKHWGYGEKSSGGLQTTSALKQYGLLEDSGTGNDRRVKLTDLAFAILLDEVKDSPDRIRAIKRASLSPKLYNELFDKWGSELPSDEAMRTYLKRDKHFNDDAVTSVISDYKDTIAFAKLDDSDKLAFIGGEVEDTYGLPVEAKVQTQQQLQPKHPTLAVGDVEPVRIALEGGGIGRVIFSGSAPTPDDIEALIDVLKIQQRQMRKKWTSVAD